MPGRPRNMQGTIDDRCSAVPHRPVGGVHHAASAAESDQVLIPVDAAQRERLARVSPQFMIARCPEDLGESLAEHAERPLDVGREFSYISSNDQPVIVSLRAQAGYQLPVLG